MSWRRQPKAWLVSGCLLAWMPLGCSGGCEPSPVPTEPAPGADVAPPPGDLRGASARDGGTPEQRGPWGESGDAGIRDAGPAPEWSGPYFTLTSSSAGIYARPENERSLKLGYARNGGRIPVLAEKVLGDSCPSGWYQGAHGGFICSEEGTIDPTDPRARLSVTPPHLDAVLPYPYARNARNGTPLYASVPSADQIAMYEPRVNPEQPLQDAQDRPWWQREQVQLSQVRLAQLSMESDGVLARRLVKGFYIAVDREFEWEGRTWYKTTKGMVAAKERFVEVQGSGYRGVELSDAFPLPIAWAYGPREQRPRYRIDGGAAKASGTLARLEPVALTGQMVEIGRRTYWQTREDDWVRGDHVRIASAPSTLPDALTNDERWISIDLQTQTLVALVGERPVYATLVSSGKETSDPESDHRTPSGEWYIREKHVTTTMDGDGSAAGDLPYSIEDVPYVMYFDGSYALHGAFWHRNYGVRMSHGCINLAPLDAKYLFFFTDPPVQKGWHGAWAGNGQKGSRVVINGAPRTGSAGP